MAEQNEDIQTEDEIIEPTEVAEGEDDTTDWKALALKNQGIAKRLKTKLEKAKEKSEAPDKSEPKKEINSNDFKFTTGDKALMFSLKQIKGADEIALAEAWIKKYGGEIDDMLEDDVFNSKLTKLREAKIVKDAIPESTKRSTGTVTNKVDFWLAKYQSGTPLNEVPQEIRNEVLNARLKADEQKHKFGG